MVHNIRRAGSHYPSLQKDQHSVKYDLKDGKWVKGSGFTLDLTGNGEQHITSRTDFWNPSTTPEGYDAYYLEYRIINIKNGSDNIHNMDVDWSVNKDNPRVELESHFKQKSLNCQRKAVTRINNDELNKLSTSELLNKLCKNTYDYRASNPVTGEFKYFTDGFRSWTKGSESVSQRAREIVLAEFPGLNFNHGELNIARNFSSSELSAKGKNALSKIFEMIMKR